MSEFQVLHWTLGPHAPTTPSPPTPVLRWWVEGQGPPRAGGGNFPRVRSGVGWGRPQPHDETESRKWAENIKVRPYVVRTLNFIYGCFSSANHMQQR